jgi:hypothetical protein
MTDVAISLRAGSSFPKNDPQPFIPAMRLKPSANNLTGSPTGWSYRNGDHLMFPSVKSKMTVILTIALSLILALAPAPWIGAADHGDGPGVGIDRSADINDVYLFLDPNDNSRVVMLLTVCGFIVPGEAVNFGIFDHRMRYRFEVESNGNATPDGLIDVTFSEKVTSGANPQTATIKSTFFPSFTAQTTNPNLNATPPEFVVTTDQNTGITFFAGLVDDPFFFDIPAFNRFVSSVLAGQPNPGFFNRARDSFAGYNTLVVARGLALQTRLGRSDLPHGAPRQLGLEGPRPFLG